MTRSELISGVALTAALAGFGASAMKQPAAAVDPQALVAKAFEPMESRVADLEAKLAKSEGERRTAERQIAESMAIALDSKRELESVRTQLEDVMGAMGSMNAQGVAVAQGKRAAGPSTGVDGEVMTGTALAAMSPTEAASLSPYGRPLSAGPAPQEVEVVRAALAKIKEEDDKKQEAERQQRRQEQQQRRLNQMAERLGLSGDQTTQLAAVWEQSQETRRVMFEAMRAEGGMGGGPGAGGPPREEMRAQMEAMRTEEQAKIAAILTPAQQAEYTKMQEEQQGPRGGGMGGAAAGGGAQGGGRRGRGGN